MQTLQTKILKHIDTIPNLDDNKKQKLKNLIHTRGLDDPQVKKIVMDILDKEVTYIDQELDKLKPENRAIAYIQTVAKAKDDYEKQVNKIMTQFNRDIQHVFQQIDAIKQTTPAN